MRFRQIGENVVEVWFNKDQDGQILDCFTICDKTVVGLPDKRKLIDRHIGELCEEVWLPVLKDVPKSTGDGGVSGSFFLCFLGPQFSVLNSQTDIKHSFTKNFQNQKGIRFSLSSDIPLGESTRETKLRILGLLALGEGRRRTQLEQLELLAWLCETGCRDPEKKTLSDRAEKIGARDPEEKTHSDSAKEVGATYSEQWIRLIDKRLESA